MNENDTPNAAATRAADNASSTEARSTDPKRTPAALLARSLQARFAAVARQTVALGLIRAGAQEFTRITTADYCHGFPEGSDYGALFPQDDLSPAEAEVIFQEAGQAVRTEAAHMKEGADPEAAGLIAAQLADWQEGAAIEWAHLVQLREQADRDDAEFDRKEEEKRKAAEKAAELASGRRYVADYLLPDADNVADPSWIAESIDSGLLIACPRCHFLHLPARPFPHSARDAALYGPPVDACDVCAALPALCNPINWGGGWEDSLAYVGISLPEERTARAVTLYDLWIGATTGADALRVAAIAEGLEGLRTLTRTTTVPNTGE